VASHRTVAIAGYLQDPSGAGLIHERLGGCFAADNPSALGLGPVMPLFETVPSPWSRFLNAVPTADALVWSSAPLPLRIPRNVPLFPIIYDLRWLKTRSAAGRVYRGLDLARVLRRGRSFFTISQTVASQLDVLTRKEVKVLPLGPGQFEGFEVPPVENTKTIVLIGNAPHKRNERAATLLVESSLVKEQYRVVGVRVSDRCARILRKNLWPARVAIFGIVPRDALADILTSASVYVSLSTDEGFGFPYVEASYFGCDVVAPDIPITREVLEAGSPTLVRRYPNTHELVTALESWCEHRIERLQRQASRLTWAGTSDALLQHIARHL
jgi:glycosyltransferase involved in cell wall biosynthesis